MPDLTPAAAALLGRRPALLERREEALGVVAERYRHPITIIKASALPVWCLQKVASFLMIPCDSNVDRGELEANAFRLVDQ